MLYKNFFDNILINLFRFTFIGKLANEIEADKDNLIFLPTVDWSTPLYQRPQHLAINLS
jgi:hypothetical protein